MCKDHCLTDSPIRFVFPLHGDCVNERDGRESDGCVYIRARVAAPADAEIYIDKQRAEFDGEYHTAEVSVRGYRNTLVAEDRISGNACKVAVYYMPDTVGKFRLSSDDNILFLQDLTKNKDVYTSIFDNPYLAIYKKAHDLYGAKVHLNLFYEFHGNHKNFSGEGREDFNLSMMTDKFKEEFRANSDWLKLAFHSRSEHPAKPYQFATAEVIREDCEKVCREILRFAGPECLNDTTTIHWGEANKECARALRAMGFRSFTGYFMHNEKGEPTVSYYIPDGFIDHIGERDFWYDTEEDILFGRIDLVLNLKTLDWVMEQMREILAHPHRGGFVSIMIHEQYFHKDYIAHLPDFEERILEPCRLLFENGYKGEHICEMTKERHLRDFPAFGK